MKSTFNRLQIEVFFSQISAYPTPPRTPFISLPNRDPSRLPFVCMYAQAILTGIYGMLTT